MYKKAHLSKDKNIEYNQTSCGQKKSEQSIQYTEINCVESLVTSQLCLFGHKIVSIKFKFPFHKCRKVVKYGKYGNDCNVFFRFFNCDFSFLAYNCKDGLI